MKSLVLLERGSTNAAAIALRATCSGIKKKIQNKKKDSDHDSKLALHSYCAPKMADIDRKKESKIDREVGRENRKKVRKKVRKKEGRLFTSVVPV